MIILAVAAIPMVSCDDSSDASPVVRFVRPVDPVMGDKLLDEVSMGSTIAVIGNNLGDVCKIYFNDRPALLNPTLVTPCSIIVTVPSTMPDTVTNKMYLETKSGKKGEFDIAVIIPSPSIDAIDCQYAPTGSELVITGKYFFARADGSIDVVFPGNVKAAVSSVSETKIVCTVPEGANIEGPISVTSAYGTSRSSFNWRSTSGLFCNFSDPTSTWNSWSLSRFGTEGGCDGQYLHLYGSVGSWAWPANEEQLMWINPEGTTLIGDGEIKDYALSFEYYIDKWDCTPMLMWFNNSTVEQNVDGTDPQYHWKPYSTGYVADKWQTATIPLSDFNTSKAEDETRTLTDKNNIVNFHMMPFGAADGPGEMDIRIDNLRIVGIK